METNVSNVKRVKDIILGMLDWRPSILSSMLIELSKDASPEGIELFNYIKELVL